MAGSASVHRRRHSRLAPVGPRFHRRAGRDLAEHAQPLEVREEDRRLHRRGEDDRRQKGAEGRRRLHAPQHKAAIIKTLSDAGIGFGRKSGGGGNASNSWHIGAAYLPTSHWCVHGRRQWQRARRPHRS